GTATILSAHMCLPCTLRLVTIFDFSQLDYVLLRVMCGRCPSTTLFPYTTLFRSGPSRGAGPAQARSHRGVPAVAIGLYNVNYGRDRQGTRLNSSHQIISYAVVCLKTKMFAVDSGTGTAMPAERIATAQGTHMHTS